MDQSLPNAIGPDDGNDPDRVEAEALTPKELRLRAVAAAARFYGMDLDINDYQGPKNEGCIRPRHRWSRGCGARACPPRARC